MAKLIGARVVRGPHWSYNNQDKGEGHLGTVINVTYNDQVSVIWDDGRELRCKTTQHSYNLRLYDNAPTGVIHTDITCGECKERNIKGIRWMCLDCSGHNLCHKCYHTGKHSKTHLFGRVDTEDSYIVKVPKREDSPTVICKGLLPGAEVLRGKHLEGIDTGGGKAIKGKLQEICEWDPSSSRGAARVKWSDRTEGRYRVGAEGRMDLRYVKEGDGHRYYRDHLPCIDAENYGGQELKAGDKVKVDVSVEELRTILKSVSLHWEDSMAVCVSNMGTLIQATEGGRLIRVQYQNDSLHVLHPMVLRKMHRFGQCDLVRVMKDRELICKLQQGHGGWSNKHGYTLGKLGRVVHIDHDADVTVEVNGEKLLFSPVCLDPVDPEEIPDREAIPPITDTLSSEKLFDSAVLYSNSGHDKADRITNNSLVKAAYKGNLSDMKEILRRNPSKLDQDEDDVTPLQCACTRGHEKIVKYLLEIKADINKADSDRNSPLHCAVTGNKSAVVKLLLDNNADCDPQNKDGRTPVHVAVVKRSAKAIRYLVMAGCDINIKDNRGNTAIHDAITAGEQNLIKKLMLSFNIDFKVSNCDGYNILQWAVVKNMTVAVECLLQKSSDETSLKMSTTGQTALHIAARFDYRQSARLLIKESMGGTKITDNKKQTPLHVSLEHGHLEFVELLLEYENDVNAQDVDGNTPLHLTQIYSASDSQNGSSAGHKTATIACLLIDHGADLTLRNRNRQTPLDLVPPGPARVYMERIARFVQTMEQIKGENGVCLPFHWKTMVDQRVLLLTLRQSEPAEKLEFKQVTDMVVGKLKDVKLTDKKASITSRKIAEVIRVQNRNLWEMYSLKKQQFERKYGKGLENEITLFHGTKSEYALRICHDNFDIRMCGTNVGSRFGQGAYFTTDVSLADSYCSDEEEDGLRYLLVTKVLAGKITYGDNRMHKPPDGYDCTVDDKRNPGIYCIFDSNQIYPQYLVKYG